MNNKKSKRIFLISDLLILVSFIIGIMLIFSNLYVLGIIQTVIALISFSANIISRYFSGKKINEMIEKVTPGTDTNDEALLSFPLPSVLLNSDGALLWYNTEFRDIFTDKKLSECTFSDLFNDFDTSLLLKKENSAGFICEASYGDRTFKIVSNAPQTVSESDKPIALLYLDDVSENVEMRKKYIAEKTFVSFVSVDNYDELMNSLQSSDVPQVQGELYKIINDWATENNGILLKYEKDKYFIIFEYKYLESFIKGKFEILSKIRSIETSGNIPASISIGIGLNGKTLSENDAYAKDALNMALGRGGDQAVIKDNEQFRFYGSATKEYEKSTRVKARVVSFALSGLIKNADNVVVLTHKNADIDGIGAAFGLLRICRIHETPIAIATDTYDKTVAKFLDKLQNTKEYEDIIITTETAKSRINDNTLIVLVDTHKVSLLDDPALLDDAKQIVVIDHHRRTADFVEHPALVYHEPYASSACEMVTEILQYTSNKMSLTKLEAEALFAGIVVDTKNFTFKTGVRTFEAASFLRKQGVDTVAVKTVFQQDLQSYIKRSEVIKSADIIRNNIAISIVPKSFDISHTIMAQAADELLNIKGITASFVIREADSIVSISGRSLGEINVQLILEKLGGGGHLTIAGAQLEDTTSQTAKEMLIEAIDDYYIDNAN